MLLGLIIIALFMIWLSGFKAEYLYFINPYMVTIVLVILSIYCEVD